MWLFFLGPRYERLCFIYPVSFGAREAFGSVTGVGKMTLLCGSVTHAEEEINEILRRERYP